MSTLKADNIANTAGVTTQRVLQVAQSELTTTFTNSSATWQDTGLSC